MDASALLKSQGWRGKGHTLHATDNSIGLANPLLLSRNTDGSGIGANKQMTDQWWLNAFDEKLKGLDTSKKGVVVQSVKKGHLNMISSAGGKYSGLYLSFVKGGLMEGTLDGESTDATPVSENGGSGPRRKETKAERRARKAAKIERRAARAAEKKRKEELKKIKEVAKKSGEKAEETKEERRARKAEAKARKEARRKRREEKAKRKAG
jgi:nucleolar protein TMA23